MLFNQIKLLQEYSRNETKNSFITYETSLNFQWVKLFAICISATNVGNCYVTYLHKSKIQTHDLSNTGESLPIDDH